MARVLAKLAAISAFMLVVSTSDTRSGGTERSQLTASGVGLGGRPVAITVRVSNARAPREGCFWWGVWLERPKKVVTSMSLKVGGNDILIPESCIAGLADVRGVLLGRSSEDSTFSIQGGETGESYEAVFVVVGDRLVRRRVVSKVFPDEAWEETRYAYNDSEE